MLSVEAVALLVGITWLAVGIELVLMSGGAHGSHRRARAELADTPRARWASSPAVRDDRRDQWDPAAVLRGRLRRRHPDPLPTEPHVLGGPGLALQIVGIAASIAGLAILFLVGRKLAAHVYRKAVDERRLMTTGVHRYVRHPFYLHFVLLPVGLFLITLNYLALLVLVSYGMLWEPRPVTSWMRGDERFLLERYGADAEAYFARTGRVLPRLRRS